MLARTLSCAIVGLEGYVVQVEVDISPGLPAFHVVGLPDTAVQEARERVRAAIRNSQCEFPMRRIAASLAPADRRKAGPSYDLPMAIAVLLASGQVQNVPARAMFLGELALDGMLRHTNGILSMVAVAKDEGFEQVFLPEPNAREAALVEGVRVMPVRDLAQAIAHLRGEAQIVEWARSVEPVDGHAFGVDDESPHADSRGVKGFDLADIRGQESGKYALEVAAAGGHNILLSGPPGSGKTLLARSMPTILPKLTNEEALEVTKVYSVTGLLPASSPLIRARPFRSPHYTISNAGLVGGGSIPKPGEITLSHRGVLFLDELPEFGHSVLEVLRQPLEDKMVTISRARGSVTYPSSFILVGAMNPCPCGFYTDPNKQCICSPAQVNRYKGRISGPLLDRIDLLVNVPEVKYDDLVTEKAKENSSDVRKRIETAREAQRRRFDGTPTLTNAEMGPNEVWEHCKMGDESREMMRQAMVKHHLSARTFHRIQKVARTVADIEETDELSPYHIGRAINLVRGLNENHEEGGSTGAEVFGNKWR